MTGPVSNSPRHSFEEGDPVPQSASSTDVYARIARHLQPKLELLGYRPGATAEFPWWYVTDGNGRMFVSAQIDTKATDPFAGAGFRLEFEKGGAGVPNAKLVGRALFFQLLSNDELRPLLDLQNRIIESLPLPPEAQINSYPEFLRAQYRSYFQPQAAFNAVQSWLRYRTLADVDRWMEMLAPLMSTVHERARTRLNADQMYLGRGQLLG